MRPLVYIAGPISADPIGGTRRAIEVWKELFDLGFAPIIPQLSVYLSFFFTLTHAEWLEYDFLILAKCAALLRLPGESPGADSEVKFAQDHDIPVYWTIAGLVHDFKGD